VQVDASIVVCQPIAERYRRTLGLDPIVVYNAPNPVDLDVRQSAGCTGHVRLIHHGYAQRTRGLERMVQAIALAEKRFTLEFMLMNDDPHYLNYLKKLAAEMAPDRVTFRHPVAPRAIVRAVAEYDVGLCVIQPNTYNALVMLPNKLFEYIQAGLAVCVGPSPAMLEIVQAYGVGVWSPSFEPSAVAQTLNRLTSERIAELRMASRRAAATLNADVEMRKVVDVYRGLLAEPGP
jgi:glycosyltransferase involved in cell wall biosynthesis